MQLAHQGLVRTRNLRKTFENDKMHAGNLQECCLYREQIPCGMQRARQELVKFTSANIDLEIKQIGCKSYQISYYVLLINFSNLHQ